jgi:glucose-6-phosphate-specific signal transduction histidine kinase
MRWIWLVLASSTAVLVWQYPEQGGVLISKLNRIALGRFRPGRGADASRTAVEALFVSASTQNARPC